MTLLALAVATVGVWLVPPGATAATTEVLVARGSVWRYLDNGTDQGTTWRSAAFDDTTWKSGPAELGYGDGDEKTVVSFGPTASRKYKTTYFRRTFTVTDPATITALALGLRRDDGAAVYLNGTEVVRSNLPAGTIGYLTDATTWDTSETTYFPYTVPTSALVAGTNTIAVEVHQNGNASSDISMDLDLTATRSGTTTTTTTAPTTTAPTSTTTTIPGPTTTTIPVTLPSSNPFYVAGDIADCGLSSDEQVAALLAARPDGTFIAVGDLAYPDGRDADFATCYDPGFGPFTARTRPVLGNHEYNSGDAGGFFRYFGAYAPPAPDGYTSFRVGDWLVLLLNSNCTAGPGCAPGQAMYQWVQGQLAANPTACIAAAWHHAPFTSESGYTRPTWMDPILSLLAANGLDVLLSGHAHSYERFARLDATGQPDPDGFRAFVVGTGGMTLRPHDPPRAGSEARNATDHGLLRLQLDPGGFSWEFVPVAGKAYADSGSDTC